MSILLQNKRLSFAWAAIIFKNDEKYLDKVHRGA